MKVINNKGGVSGLALSLAGVGFIAVIAAIFAVVFYSGEMNYKNNDQILINKAVSVATAKEAVIKDQQFTLQNENPFVSYTGPVQYGTINVSYPKTWSAYIDTTGSSEPLEAYFNPFLCANTGSNLPLIFRSNWTSYSLAIAFNCKLASYKTEAAETVSGTSS